MNSPSDLPQKRGNAASKVLWILALTFLFGTSIFVCIRYYSFVFSRSVKGEFINIERIAPPAIIPGASGSELRTQMFSFAIAIRGEDGEIHTASSEDRQWAVVTKGMCGEARFYPYPFWDLEKTGTWMNARLMKMYDCEQPRSNLIPVPAASMPAESPTP